MMKRISIYTIGLMVAVALTASYAIPSDQVPAPPQDHPIALVGGVIHTITGETIEGGTILFDNGKITAIGTNVALPDGTEQIDVSGKHVYPGLVSAITRLGLVEIGSVPATVDASEMGSMNPNVRVEVAINPDTELIPVARANGITVANSVPRGGTLSGKSAAIMLDGWTWEDLTLKAPVAMHMNWPNMTTFSAWWMTQTPDEQRKNREKNINRIHKFFDEAAAYKKAFDANAPGRQTDVRLEAMLPVLNKEIPMWFHVNEIKQIEASLDFAKERGIKAVIAGGADSWRLTDELIEANVPVVAGPILATPSRAWEGYDSRYTLPAKLYEAGVKFCITDGGSRGNERNLPYHAAMAVAFGLPADEAIKAITIYPAEIMGIGDMVGSLETGKDATIIVTTGNPLELSTNVELEFIQGRKIDLGNKHQTLYEKYTDRYKQMGIIE